MEAQLGTGTLVIFYTGSGLHTPKAVSNSQARSHVAPKLNSTRVIHPKHIQVV